MSPSCCTPRRPREQLGARRSPRGCASASLEAAQDNTDEERSRRLESDAEAVQVLTVHRSKGLEFPVVYYPDLWEPSPTPRDDAPPGRLPRCGGDPDHRRRRSRGRSGAHIQRNVDEQRGEDLRLAYVALTRAKHQAVIWWAGSFDSRNSALTRLLFSATPTATWLPSSGTVPSDAEATARFRELQSLGAGVRQCRRVRAGTSRPVGGTAPRRAQLSASSFDRTLDWWWRTDVLQRHHRGHATRRAWRASPRSRSWTTSRPRRSGGVVAGPAASELQVPSLLAGMPVGVGGGDARAPGLRAHGLRGGGSRLRAR